MDETQLGRWVEGYVRAWSSNDPAEIGELFAADAAYRTDPPRAYRNLWVVRLDPHGRCREFTEWWMREPTTDDAA